MSPLAELHAGKTGDAFNALLKKTIAAVASGRNFPPPEGKRWTKDQIDDVARAYLAHKRTPKAISTMVAKCGDDAALARYLQGVIRNFLRDMGRATEIGRLTGRVRRALREAPAFVNAHGDYWGRGGGSAEASGVGPDALIAAAAKVKVVFVKWSPTARRNHPFADKASIDALITAVLKAAGGTVRAQDIAVAIAPSLLVVTGPETVEVDSGDYPDVGWRPAGFDETGDDVVDRERAIEVIELLTDREKISLAYPGLNVRELGALIGRGHTQAGVVRNKAIAMLQSELGEEPNGQRVGELVIEFAKIWVQDRTDPNDVTY